MKPKLAHIFEPEDDGHYVEPEWTSRRLFDVEDFHGPIWDPACGFGRIPDAAKALGVRTLATDIVDRGYRLFHFKFDFLRTAEKYPGSIVCNPPFHIFERFALHAIDVAVYKVAMIWQVPRLNAARWLQGTPLARVHLLTPRPSTPPGHVISAGGKASGGTQDFCWLVWDKTHSGPPSMHWLHRDGVAA